MLKKMWVMDRVLNLWKVVACYTPIYFRVTDVFKTSVTFPQLPPQYLSKISQPPRFLSNLSHKEITLFLLRELQCIFVM
jgi:hypothetical protein